MILAGLERDTGRAVAFGIPRNLVNVQLGGRAGEELRRFLTSSTRSTASRTRSVPTFPGGRDPGATALKQAISHLLGLRVDYYAMVDLDGFRDLVDVLGGVKIRVRERIADEVTRPAWGETKPRINVYPGRTYHFDGRTALAYVRSRKDSDDYRRMHRQRCFLTAVANQLDVVSVLRNWRPGVDRGIERADRYPARPASRPHPPRRPARPEADSHGHVRPPLHRPPARVRPLPDRQRRSDAHDGARRFCNYARTPGATSKTSDAPAEGGSPPDRCSG